MKEKGEMKFYPLKELTENLVILFEEYNTSRENEAIQFPTEDEIYNQILGTEPALTSTPTEDLEFKPNEPIAVLWNKDDGTRYWCVSFFMYQVDDDTIKVDHLQQKYM